MMRKEQTSSESVAAPCLLKEYCHAPCSPSGGTMSTINDSTLAAKLFIDRFGDDAPDEARRRATEMRLFGETVGYETWMNILDQINDITGKERLRTRH